MDPRDTGPVANHPPLRLSHTPRGVRCDRPAELLDIYPTLVEGVGLGAADSDRLLDGCSLLPWLNDPDREKDRPAITTIYAHNHSVCDTRHRYTRYADGAEELYDRGADPNEFDNLIERVSTDEGLRAVVDDLSGWIPSEEAGEPDLVMDRLSP